MPTKNPRPLVFLDVDGVINDLSYVPGCVRDFEYSFVSSHGHTVVIPDYMPALVQWLCSIAEVHWCTAWRHRANDEIADFLGIEKLPVVDDGTTVRHTEWKAAAAFELAAGALSEGRRVLWIEDFYDRPPVREMPKGVEFVDTASHERFELVLDAFMLPDWLIAESTPKVA